MAITVDQSSIGTTTIDSLPGTGNFSFNTTNAVSSGGFIVVFAGLTGTNDLLSTFSGGGLTWNIDKSGGGGSKSVAIVSAQAPSGLSAGTTLSGSWGAGAAFCAAAFGAMSLLGVKTSSPVDGTPLGPTITSVQTWSAGSYSITAGSIIVAGCFSDGGGASHAPTSPSLEAWEALDTIDTYGSAAVYRIEGSAGSYSTGGQWAASGATANVAVAYLAAAGGGGGTTVKTLAALGVG